ncbi:transposase [Neolewinella sp.]|uniref:transposase n=1 Tax=Neolewinella sp. TaxID=2993543 RepID=UPI003B5248A7
MSKRRTHSASFKKKVALEAIREELTMAELSRKHQLHASQIKTWKRVLTHESDELFGSKRKGNRGAAASFGLEDKQRDELLRIIGKLQVEKLQVENEFLKKTLS